MAPSAEEGVWFFLPKCGREKRLRRGEDGTEEGGDAAGEVIVNIVLLRGMVGERKTGR